jgi:pRiA4b ORF-3-like protein
MIWRQSEVPDSITIAGLREVLRVAFGWSGEHLHRFTVHGKEYGICYRGGMTFDDDPRQVRLVDLGLRERERFAYTYGFSASLEGWCHDLRVQSIEAPRVRRRYPWCGGGARSAPPEQCAGLFLQVRTQVLNNDLAAHFKRWYPGFTHHSGPVELAA